MITDYASLLTEIASELNRTDLANKTPLWVHFAENRARRDLDVGRGHENNVDYRDPYESINGTTVVTNWLLVRHPDIYFYGALLHSAPYFDDDQRIATWERFYGAAVSAANLRAQEFPSNTDDSFLQLSSSLPICPAEVVETPVVPDDDCEIPPFIGPW